MSIYIQEYLESKDLYYVCVQDVKYMFYAYMHKDEIIENICSNYSDYF